jgi:hypothetical protein
MQGYLTKPNKSFGSKKWFFVLERCTLTYYENDTKAEKLAEITLNAETRISAAGALQINIDNVSVGAKTSDKTSYVLLCNDDPQKRDTWIAALKGACDLQQAERVKARQAEDVARQRAEEAERVKAQQEKERIESERRQAEDVAPQQAPGLIRFKVTPNPVISRKSKFSPGCGGIPELLEIWPEAADTVNPAEIRKIWSDKKMCDFASSATEDMESGGVRDRCAQAVQGEDLKIAQLERLMSGVEYEREEL